MADSFCGSTPVLPIDSLTGVPTSATELFTESKSTSDHHHRVKFIVLRFSVLSSLGSSLSPAETTYKRTSQSARSIRQNAGRRARSSSAEPACCDTKDVLKVHGSSSNH